MRDVAGSDFAYEGTADDTAGLVVRFEMYPVKDDKASLEAGRPIYNEVEFIDIRIPGDRTLTVHRPVREADKRRFAVAYRNWKARGGDEGASSGTPLKEWPAVSRSQVEELAFFNVRTVEQLAAVTDGNLKNIGPLLALREKARDFVKAATAGAPLQQMRDELEASKREAEMMRKQMAELMAAVSTKEEKASKKSKSEA